MLSGEEQTRVAARGSFISRLWTAWTDRERIGLPRIGPIAGAAVALAAVAAFQLLVGALVTPILTWKHGKALLDVEAVALDGDVNGIGGLVGGLLGGAVILIYARWRLGSLRAFTGSRPLKVFHFAIYTAALFALNWLAETIGRSLGVPEIPESMLSMYKGTHCLPALVLTIVIVGPLFEELLFRGLLLPAWARLPGGPAVAVAMTAAFWSLLHVQYYDQPYWLAVLFVLGVFFGIARVSSGGLFVPIVLHILNNAAALTQIALVTEPR